MDAFCWRFQEEWIPLSSPLFCIERSAIAVVHDGVDRLASAAEAVAAT